MPLKVNFVAICAFERENQSAVALDRPLGGSAVSRVASNVTAFWWTCEVFECEGYLLSVLLQVTRTHFNFLHFLFLYELEWKFRITFLNSISAKNLSFIFVHLSLKVERVNVGDFELEN